MISDLKRRVGESEAAFIYRICSMKGQIGRWDDIKEILNRELGYEYTESAYRKKYQQGQAYVIANEEVFAENESYLESMRQEREKLQRERYKLQTEKLEYNKWLREHARDELFEEKIIESIYNNVGKNTPVSPIASRRDERCGVLSFADCHFGADFFINGLNGKIINAYNPDIFYERMEKLLGETIDYCKKEDLKTLKIFNLGDSLDGFLRHEQLKNLRYGVIDSAILFADYMSRWLRKLSEHIGVEYYWTDGNHGELRLLDGRKGAHVDDNIEKVVAHIIKIYNEDNPNFEMICNDSGFIFTEAVGYNILGIHGEVKDLKAALKDYADIYDVKIDYLFAGHKHHTTFDNCGVKKGCIGVGSIVGSDNYSFKLRKSADATASLIIFEKNKGKTDEHTFVLN